MGTTRHTFIPFDCEAVLLDDILPGDEVLFIGYDTWPRVDEMKMEAFFGVPVLLGSHELHELGALSGKGYFLKNDAKTRRVLVKWLLSFSLGNDVAHESAKRLVREHQEDYPVEIVIDRYRLTPRLKE